MKIDIVKNKNISKEIEGFINDLRQAQWPEDPRKDFEKSYEPDTRWLFLKDKNKILAIGGLRPIKINYLGKEYKIEGICSIISVEKGKGYGKIIMQKIINILKKENKTGLGFCGHKITVFYEKAGLKTEKDFIKRFIYKNPKTGEEIMDNHGDGIYYEGKDKFVSKVLKSKNLVFISVLHW